MVKFKNGTSMVKNAQFPASTEKKSLHYYVHTTGYEAIQSPIKWMVALSPMVKWREIETNHPPLFYPVWNIKF
jgi:hypothetical protein